MSIVSTLATLRRTDARTDAGHAGEFVDLAFALAGESLPKTYAFRLEAALIEALPWFADEPQAGIHPIRGPVTDFGLILSQRARLILRIPAKRVRDAGSLSGQELAIGPAALRVGAATLRPIVPFATLRSWHVATGAADEQGFVDDVAFQLEVLGIKAQMICGKPERLAEGERQVGGFGLALHDLSPAHSLLLQVHGLGACRRLGCGLFVQHKIITDLGGDPQ
jgi:CRISPR-associated protein Cas6